MIARFTLILIGFGCWLSALPGETAQNPAGDDSTTLGIIRNIIISGNDQTRPFVILREMKLKRGSSWDPKEAEADRKRILNLNLFSRVEFNPIRHQDGIILIIIIVERLYIYPYPILFRNERGWEKISYGMGLVHANFRGCSERLNLSGWAGYNPTIQFKYQTPWLLGIRDWSGNISFYYTRVRSLNLEIEQYHKKQYGIAFNIGHRFGYHIYLDVGIGYSELKISPNTSGITLSSSGIDKIPQVNINYRYDTRDLYEYPKSGWFLQLSVAKYGFSGAIDYWQYGTDLRHYIPIVDGVSLGLRTASTFTLNTVPIYDRIYIGYSERIRGHFDDKWEAENRLMGSAELRFPILPIRYFDLDSEDSLFGSYMKSVKFGISGGIFFDTGALWFQDTPDEKIKPLSGFGVGLHFHIPYINILRAEVGFDKNWQPELILDALVAF